MDATDLRALRQRVDAALTAPRRPYAEVLQRRMRTYVALQVAELVVLLLAPWWAKVVVASVFAVYRARTIWTVVHERVHRRELPNTPSKLLFDFFTVFVARWWRRHHLRHHACVNTPDDPDTRMFLGRDLNDARRPGRPSAARGLATVAQFPFLFALFLYRCLSAERERAAVHLALVASYGVTLAILLPPAEAALNGAANFFVGGAWIVLTFAPTHSASAENFALTGDPLRDVFVSTNDVWPRSAAWSRLCGGINLHVAHHLFPGLPYRDLLVVQPVVEAFARERGLPYHAWSPLGLWRAHLRLLWRA